MEVIKFNPIAEFIGKMKRKNIFKREKKKNQSSRIFE